MLLVLTDRTALEQQIEVLILKKQRLENLIALACGIKKNGEKYMDFSAFDTSKIQEYKKEAKAAWGKTAEYQEYEQKTKDRKRRGISGCNDADDGHICRIRRDPYRRA